jgi:hypothetical protein
MLPTQRESVTDKSLSNLLRIVRNGTRQTDQMCEKEGKIEVEIERKMEKV